MKPKKIITFLLAISMLLGLCGCSTTASGLIIANAKNTMELHTIELAEKANAHWATYQEKQTVGEPVNEVVDQSPISYAIQYPQTGKPVIDARIQEIAKELHTSFEQEYQAANAENETSAKKKNKKKKQEPTEVIFYLSYETYVSDNDQMTLVFFPRYETDGTLYPAFQIHMFHFDLTEDKEVPAAELMWENWASNASAYTIEHFTTTEPYAGKLHGSYKTLLAPESGRFERFALTPEGALFYFEPYTIAPGNLGLLSLVIPYEELQKKIEEPPTPEETAERLASLEGKKLVALTYDDGPNPIHTTAILNTLEKYDARATFFDLGYLVERHPNVVKREVALGCEVGSHSYDHKDFNKLNNAQIAADIKASNAAFLKVLGKEPTIFRPPYGNCNANVKTQLPMSIYLWSVDTLDWKSRNANAVVNAVKAAGNLDGKVILMHGIYGSTAQATAILVPYLQEQGYELVTISELMQVKYKETPQPNTLYGYSYFQ